MSNTREHTLVCPSVNLICDAQGLSDRQEMDVDGHSGQARDQTCDLPVTEQFIYQQVTNQQPATFLVWLD